MATEIEEKTGRLAELLGSEGLSGVLLNAQHNFAWITGGSSNYVDTSRENGVASILITKEGHRFLLANNIEMLRLLGEEVSAEDFEPMEFAWQDEKASPDFLIELARKLAAGEVGTDISMHPRTRAIESTISRCRHELTPEEAERFRELGRDAGRVMQSITGQISPGQTETEIAEKMRAELAAGSMTSVVTLVAADERIAKFRHPVPSSNRWNKLLLLVTCAKRGGLIASLSRIVCIGEVPEKLQQKTKAAAYVNACLMASTTPGKSGAELYAIAADAYADKGFADEIDKHHQGGAAGYKTREWVAHPASRETVKQNQAFAWNPSITGTKIEETIIVTASGAEVITASADFPSIETVICGRSYFSPGILSI